MSNSPLPQDDVAAIDELRQVYQRLSAELKKIIVGQDKVVEQLSICLFARGHALLMGVPGLAKTLLISRLAETMSLSFSRIQFTPDLMPMDITGTDILQELPGGKRAFEFAKGPVFANIVLADEINRAPAKTQAAMLEAMQEHKVTVAGRTYTLDSPFFVLATQNPIEQEGTYPLPEAQLDRFLMHVTITYPNNTDEKAILHLARDEARAAGGNGGDSPHIIGQQDVFDARRAVLEMYLSDDLEQYLLEIVLATRDPKVYGEDLAEWIEYGASPRASIALDRCARAHAWLDGRDYVGPEDIQAIAPDVLRHRIILNYEAVADGVTPDQFISELISRIAVP